LAATIAPVVNSDTGMERLPMPALCELFEIMAIMAFSCTHRERLMMWTKSMQASH